MTGPWGRGGAQGTTDFYGVATHFVPAPCSWRVRAWGLVLVVVVGRMSLKASVSYSLGAVSLGGHTAMGGGVKGVDNDPASSEWPSLSAESLKVEESAGEPSSVM